MTCATFCAGCQSNPAKAKEKLALVEKACGKAACAPAQALSAAIAKGPVIRIQTAEAAVPNAPSAQQN